MAGDAPYAIKSCSQPFNCLTEWIVLWQGPWEPVDKASSMATSREAYSDRYSHEMTSLPAANALPGGQFPGRARSNVQLARWMTQNTDVSPPPSQPRVDPALHHASRSAYPPCYF